MKLLILDNFDSFTFNLFQYCSELGAKTEVFRNNEISLAQIKKNKYTHIIISPGPGTPERKKDFGICGSVIKKFGINGKQGIPILGVCLGHQGIVAAFGGKIVRAPEPVHGKQSRIRIDNTNPLFEGLPKTIEAMRYHSLVAEKKSLPRELKIIAETVKDGLIMAISHRTLPLFGVQFHPESIGTETGKRILKNFLKISPKTVP
jgi:anthranilate synthase component 2